MRKSHFKYTPTMAPTLNMLAKFSKEERTSARQASHKSLHRKLTRSISSFGKPMQDSPSKKKNIFGHKLQSSILQSSPIQNLIQIFKEETSASSQQQILSDVTKRFTDCQRTLTESIDNSRLLALLLELKGYVGRTLQHIMLLQQKKIDSYLGLVDSMRAQHEKDMKSLEHSTKARLGKQLQEGKSELGKRLATLRNRALFTSKIFHEMESSGINIEIWIAESQLMDNYIAKAQCLEHSLSTFTLPKDDSIRSISSKRSPIHEAILFENEFADNFRGGLGKGSLRARP